MRWWELLRHSLAGAARARMRSTLTSLGVAIGSGALVSMVAFALGLQQQLEKPFEQLGLLSDIHVFSRRANDASDEQGASQSSQPEGAGKSQEAQGTDRPRLLDDAALEELRQIPGVEFAYPDIRLHDLQVALGDKTTRAYALSLPREASLLSLADEMIIAGSFFSIDDAPEALVPMSIVEDLGFDSAAAAVGAQIVLSAAGLTAEGQGQFQFERESIRVSIVGVYQSPGFGAFGGARSGALVLPVDVMHELPGAVESRIYRMRRSKNDSYQGYGRVVVRVERPAEVFAVEQSIKDLGFNTRTMLSNLEEARTFFLFLEVLLGAVGAVGLVVAGLGIANTLLMTVLERYQEIGVYKAIGATDGDVRLMFLFEAAVLGLVGGLLGLVLAGCVCWGLQHAIDAYMRHEGIERAVEVFYFPWWLLAGAVAFSALVSVASGIYPASRAARVDPIAALRRA